MIKSLYPQPLTITTVDPVPADSRFYAVNERIHRFPSLKPNALTEVGLVLHSIPNMWTCTFSFFIFLCSTSISSFSSSYHEALWILCIFNVRHCFFLDSLLHWCLTPCWAVVKTYTLVWVGVAHGAPPPPVENRGTLEWTWGNLLLSGVCGVLLWIRNLPGEYWKDKWLAGFQMPYEEKICATLCTDNACLTTTMEHCMYVRG